MSDDHHRLHAELAIGDLERAADDYRTMAATAPTHSDRDSYNRVANGFERIAERRKAGVAPLKYRDELRMSVAAKEFPRAGRHSMIGRWSGDGDPLLSITISNQSGRRYHLTVENLAPNKWGWLAWQVAEAPGQLVLRGVTASPGTAKVGAEDAVVTLEMSSLDLRKQL